MTQDSTIEISAAPTDRTGAERPGFLVFAIPVSLERGVTGATVGTKLIVEQVSEKCDVTWIKLQNPGLPGAGKPGYLGKVLRVLKTTAGSLKSLSRLIGQGLSRKKVTFVYFVPSSSLFGTLRDAILTIFVKIFFQRAKIILHIRNGNYFEYRNPIRAHIRNYVTNQANSIIVLSRRLLPDLGRGPSTLESKIWVLPNTIDVALIPSPYEITQKRSRHDEPISVLFFSNFLEEKGCWTLLEAGALLTERGLGALFRFTFHGKWLSDQDREAFKKRAGEITEAGLEITVGDPIGDRRHAQRLYAAHDVFCLPTSYGAEAQPRSVLEAMANACAIVATDYRSIPDMVIDRRNGILIARRDPGLLADALQALTQLDLAAMQAESRRLFEEHFSPESVRACLYQGLGL